ncbi:hypothetical protein Ddye_032194 [Dipteronia dyeriana]|uniref:RNase H type-1 domain-containing protein n=1 Tax=Dipteronia dyeriana TaxID=168575 RepID=A0AAD9TJT5_9ROSI|nr:hypothetical protein Ddye_032194 [Dipteronia dyeriana]
MVDWIPPPNGSFKFNADGPAKGSPGHAGIGRVLRDHNGKVLYIAFANVGIEEAVTAKILAIAKACSLCMSRPTFLGKNIVFVIDSKVVVSWVVNGSGIGSLKHVHTIYDIPNHLRSFGQASMVYYCSRASNSFADMLAKQGSEGDGEGERGGGG